jgi:hypothetical protein
MPVTPAKLNATVSGSAFPCCSRSVVRVQLQSRSRVEINSECIRGTYFRYGHRAATGRPRTKTGIEIELIDDVGVTPRSYLKF